MIRLSGPGILCTTLVLCSCGTTAVVTTATTPTTPAPKQIWVSAWADAPEAQSGPASAEQTFRVIVKPTVGSRGTVRLHFSNFFGSAPITLGAVHVGLQTSAAGVQNDRAVTFSGLNSVTIPANGFVTSDQINLSFSYGQNLSITEYVTGSWTGLTQHNQGGGTVTSYQNVQNSGDGTSDSSGTRFTQTTTEVPLLDRVDVLGAYKGTVAAFGGSTTDGYNSGLDLHKTYPEQLADALHAAGRDDVAIANAGIVSNQLLGTSTTSGEQRFSRDVLALPSVFSVIDYIGANDLRNSCVAAAAVIAGQQTLITQAHAAGITLYLATIAPSTFCGAQNPNGFGSRFAQGTGEESQRFLLNQWINSTGQVSINGVTVPAPLADAIIDFSGVLSDPSNLSYMLPSLNSGDDIHPNAAGYGAMAAKIPLTLF